MKKPLLYYLLLVLVPVFTLVSCDHRVVDPAPLGQFRLAQIDFQVRDGIRSNPQRFILAYDQKGLLSSYAVQERTRFGPNDVRYLQVSTYTVYRNAQDQIDSVTPSVPIHTRARYFRNERGLISRISYFSPGEDRYYYRTNDTEHTAVTFSYDGASARPASRNNTVTTDVSLDISEAYTYINGNATTINQTTYTYDDKPNPYYGLIGLNLYVDLYLSTNFYGKKRYSSSDEFADIQVKLFNKNNITTDTRQITYNADGLVSRIEYMNGNVEEFTYERKP